MKLKFVIALSILFLSLKAPAQWIQKANFAGTAKAKSIAFTIGNKIYVMGGVDNSVNILNNFWEYDILSDTWTQQPDFPGPERYGAVSFVLNNKGYIATGANDFGYLDDLWEYDPAIGSWIQKTGLPATTAQHENQRREAYTFVIGNKAYVGGGDGFVFGPNSTSNIAFYDLWEYDALSDSWTQKADVPNFVGKDFSVAGVINNKAYVGLGCNVDQTINHQDFWEYDPISDFWTAKASFPSNFTVDAAAFVLNSDLYVAGGVNLNPVSLSNQFYKYDPATDSWTQLSAFNGGAIAGAFAVSTGITAYMGTGYNASIVTRNDLWEFTVLTGITQNNLPAGISAQVFPNPASDFINVKMNSALPETVYSITDVEGKKVLQGEFVKENSKINISALPAGVYILRAGQQEVHKFLKK